MIPISPRYRLDRLAAPVLRLGMTAAHGVRRLRWRMRGAVPEGVCAIVIAPDDAIVLVRHRYVRGWRIPSGGIHAGEAPRDAVIRELEEEIGLTAWSRVALAERRTRLAGGIGGPLHIFVVRDAVCAPRWPARNRSPRARHAR